MKSVRSFLYFLMVFIMSVSSCEKGVLSLDGVGGERYPFHSPLTALSSDGERLWMATDEGVVASFDKRNGLIAEVYSLDCGTIYQMLVDDGFFYYTVQDGGIRRRSLSAWNAPEESFVLSAKKGSHFSAYELLLDKKERKIYAATSNGFFCWDMDAPDQVGEALISRDLNTLRFYSVTPWKDSLYVAGQPGAYRTTGAPGDTVRTNGRSILSLHDGYQLFQEKPEGAVGIAKGYGADGEVLTRFRRQARSFVVHDSYIYAISETAVECIDLSGGYAAEIRLPEKRLHRPRNKSTRAIGLVDGPYLYVAPGGTALYRLPLAPYVKSDEIISIVPKDTSGVYALSADRDLFRVDIHPDGRFGKPRYIRSFPSGDVRLLGADENGLILLVNGSVYRATGKKKLRLLKMPDADSVGRITCQLYDDGVLYLGRSDVLRRYSHLDSDRPDPYLFSHLRDDDGIQSPSFTPDYYPTRLGLVREAAGKKLVFGTLHDGIYAVDAEASDHRFDCLVTAGKAGRIEDIQAVRSSPSAFALTKDTLFRFRFQGDSVSVSSWPVASFGETAALFNRILPVSEEYVFLNCDHSDFCQGAYGYRLDEDQSVTPQGSLFVSHTLNDATLIGDVPVFGGSMGLGNGREQSASIEMPAPASLRRVDAETYPWGRLLTLLAIVGLLYSVFLAYERLIRWRDARRADRDEIMFNRLREELYAWCRSAFKTSSILRLAQELVSRSKDARDLQEHISAFRQEGERLAILDRIGMILKAADEEDYNADKQLSSSTQTMRKQYQKDYEEQVRAFFSVYSASDPEDAEWRRAFKTVGTPEISGFKKVFLSFPACAEMTPKACRKVGYLCVSDRFPVTRSEWKKEAGNEDKDLHRLYRLMGYEDWGLLSLIAGVGLK